MGPNAGTAVASASESAAALSTPQLSPFPTTQTSSTGSPPPVSRYRSLRGKSVSSVRHRGFDVFPDENETTRANGKGGPPLPLPAPVPPLTLRDRASTISPTGTGTGTGSGTGTGTGTGTRTATMTPAMALALGTTGLGSLGPHHELYPDLPIPPIPANLVLSPKSTNVPSVLANRKRLKGILLVDKPSNTPPSPPRTPVLSSDILQKRRALNLNVVDANSNIVAQSRDKFQFQLEEPSPPPSLSPPSSTSSPRSSDASVAGERGITSANKPQFSDRLEAARWAREVARLDAETDRILAEQKKRDLARLQAQLAASPARPRALTAGKNNFLHKLNPFARAKKQKAKTPPSPPRRPGTPGASPPSAFSFELSPPSTGQSSPTADTMALYDRGSSGPVSQTDAPASAINGGDRRVTVRCMSSTISLPVTADTSSTDILFSAANFMTHNINPSASLLVECYTSLGLERRLRRYEHIRDIMNSWDRDSQNSLLVVCLETADDDQDLDIASVPRSQESPPGFVFQLHHSSRRGKWDKRWIMLLDNGQVLAAKKSDAKPSDKDSTALCHLSDFDIYKPKESETRRRLRAPCNFCYAIKSQQKSIVFPDGENYVHFFSTDDSTVARQFYDLVHAWRSWYLANKLGKLGKKTSNTSATLPQRTLTQKSTSQRPQNVVKDDKYRLRVSVDQTPYTIGAFEPLLDMDRFNKPIEEFGKDLELNVKTERKLSKKGPNPKAPIQSPPPMPKASITPKADANFSPTGLLGDGYEKRKLTLDTSEPLHQGKEEGPFTGGPSLLNSGIVTSPDSVTPQTATSWFPSAEEHSARNRSQTSSSSKPSLATRTQSTRSTRGVRRPQTSDGPSQSRRDKQPQPLVNLTDSFPQPPQWRGNNVPGHGMKAPAGSPLINFATGGTLPHQIPSNGGPPRGMMRTQARSSSATHDKASTSSSSSSSRPRSRSAAPPPSGSRYRAPEDAPPMPPLPVRSVHRDAAMRKPGATPRDREGRMQEPLVNRAR